MTPLEASILETATFRRLRGVKQLGLANYVFPGADYSRFSHCVGVSHVAGRMITALRSVEVEISDEDEQLYRAAALLHDLGHYPFSHAMERAVETVYGDLILVKKGEPQESADGQDAPTQAPFDHEGLGSLLIAESEIASILEAGGIDPALIVAIIQHEDVAPPLANLVSSDLDADRIDYLLRTSVYTGLPYGHIDLDYLLSMIRVDSDSRICLDRRALRTAEHLLLARYFDYQQVSYHKTVAAFEWLLEDTLAALVRNDYLDCSASAMSALAQDPSAWSEFDDSQVLGRIREFSRDESADPLERDKARALLGRRGPKVVWSQEWFADRDQVKERRQMLRTILAGTVTEVAEEFGLAPEQMNVWAPKAKPLTSIGSKVAASRIIAESSAEEKALGQVVRIMADDFTSVPLTECADSLMSVLSTESLGAVRVYVHLKDDQAGLRDHVAEALGTRMTAALK